MKNRIRWTKEGFADSKTTVVPGLCGCINRFEWMFLTIRSESHAFACWLLAEAQGTVVIGL